MLLKNMRIKKNIFHSKRCISFLRDSGFSAKKSFGILGFYKQKAENIVKIEFKITICLELRAIRAITIKINIILFRALYLIHSFI